MQKLFNNNIKHTHKLFEVISTLEASEVTQIRKMLKSPFFTHRDDLLVFFNSLISTYRRKHTFPSLEQLFETVYPDQSWDYPKLRNAMSDLLRLIEECWLINNHRANPIQEQLTLANIYRKRSLDKSYHSTIQKSQKLLEGVPNKNKDYYYALMTVYSIQMQYQSSTNRIEDFLLQEVSDTIDVLFLTQKLPIICAQLAHQLIRKKEYDYGLLKGTMSLIEQSHFLDIPAIAIYYYCFKFLTAPEPLIYFNKFRILLEANKQHFTTEELEAPFRLAINFCIRKSNEGIQDFRRISWELYKEGIDNGVLLENNFIPRFTFNNVVAAALRLNELDWIENFISHYAELLEDSFRQQTIHFNFARLEFARSNFQKALTHIQQAETKDVMNNMISKILLTKIFMEIGAIDSFNSHINSFEQFIRRNEVSDYHRTNVLNLLKYCRKIISRPTYDNAAKIKIISQIKSESILSERTWLLEKI